MSIDDVNMAWIISFFINNEIHYLLDREYNQIISYNIQKYFKDNKTEKLITTISF